MTVTDKQIKRKNEQIQILEARINLRNRQLMELQNKLEQERKEKQEQVDMEKLRQMILGEVDWFKVFRDAYNSRPTSWWEVGHIQEWRNATDEVSFAVLKQITEIMKNKNSDNKPKSGENQNGR